MIMRHGDLLIVRIDRLPKGLTPANNPVLAYGETTGHTHRLTGRVLVFENKKNKLMGTTPTKYFRALEPQKLVHKQHKPIHIEEGTYAVIQEREFDFFEQEIRRVVD